MQDAESGERPRRQPGWDALVEDLIGLNLRALLTIRDMFVRPRIVFDAARSDDWHDRYTPSIRLALSLLALMLLLRFLWGGEDSTFFSAFRTQIEFALRDVDVAIDNAFVRNALDGYLLFFPIAFAGVSFALAFILRIWGRRTGYVTRLRFYFLALTPNLTFSLAWLPFLAFLDGAMWAAATIASVGVVFTLDVVTALRGGVAGATAGARVWRAFVFGAASLVGLQTTAWAASAAGLAAALASEAP